ncbi:MAG: hypothetical protein ACW986_01350 [Promethearchaeota archaeon]|jgi:hypothetical protein
MSNNLKQELPDLASSLSERKNQLKKPTVVITVRIDEELNHNLDGIKNDLGISKADLIRNYLELSNCLIKQKNSVKSLDDRDFIIVKRSYLRKLVDKVEQEQQISLGDKFARFINAIALIKNRADDLNFKLDMCNNLGFFRKYVDDQNYVLISKKFGPGKFVESFAWRLFKNKEFNPRYTDEELKGSKSLTQQYKKEIQKADRISSYYSFEFAKMPEE